MFELGAVSVLMLFGISFLVWVSELEDGCAVFVADLQLSGVACGVVCVDVPKHVIWSSSDIFHCVEVSA